MKLLNSWFRENFGYSKKEVNGSLVLVILILLGFSGTYAFDYYLYASADPFDERDVELLQQWSQELQWERAEAPPKRSVASGNANSWNEDLKTLRPRVFDPNLVTREELLSMNISGYLASNWTKYLAGGGRLFKKTDLLKLYGMDSSIYRQLEPFVSFGGDERAGAKPEAVAEVKESAVLMDINLASAEELQTVKGIGPAYSQRIVKYRDILGGFASKHQLAEVYGLKPEVVQSIWASFTLDSVSCCIKASLNEISADSLKKHPYLTYNQANAIVAYRQQHGPFHGWDDVAEIRIISDSVVQKLKPYFVF